MATTFRRNPRLAAELRRSPKVRALLREKASDVAREAQRLGGQVADSYDTKVDDAGDRVRVEARTDGINAAAWIEFGTGFPTPTPAHAPLRRAVEQAGLRTEGGRRRG